MTSQWTREAIAHVAVATHNHAPVIERKDVRQLLPGFDLWDYWPVQERDGRTALIAGGTLYMLLSAPVIGDPDARHGLARIRLMHERDGQWRDLGNLLPDEFSPGSREWSGSAVIDEQHRRVTLYFTAAGHRGEKTISFDQRMFETSAALAVVGDVPGLSNWSEPVECVAPDDKFYASDMAGGGEIGTIKAFRDPFWFRDPHDGAEYILFAASLASSASSWNGVVGVARRYAAGWHLAAPLISADTINNELERPHVICHGGRYYCFWSTQRSVFNPQGPLGPNGMYGMIADAFAGPWRPLNESGLVFANPVDHPVQAYSWQVLGDLSVISFIDRPGLTDNPVDADVARAHFGGAPAPQLRLVLDGEVARLA